MDLRALFAYSDNCRALLRKTLDANPESWDQPFVAPLQEFNSIRQIVIHTAGAEERWVKMRICGKEVPFYRDRAPQDVAGVFADWNRFRVETYSFLDTQTPEDLQKVHSISLGSGDWVWKGDLTVEQMLFHVLNHETHHRGQVSMAWQQMGIDPPDFDFIFLRT